LATLSLRKELLCLPTGIDLLFVGNWYFLFLLMIYRMIIL